MLHCSVKVLGTLIIYTSTCCLGRSPNGTAHIVIKSVLAHGRQTGRWTDIQDNQGNRSSLYRCPYRYLSICKQVNLFVCSLSPPPSRCLIKYCHYTQLFSAGNKKQLYLRGVINPPLCYTHHCPFYFDEYLFPLKPSTVYLPSFLLFSLGLTGFGINFEELTVPNQVFCLAWHTD